MGLRISIVTDKAREAARYCMDLFAEGWKDLQEHQTVYKVMAALALMSR